MEDSDHTPDIDIDIDYDIEVKKELLDEEVQHSIFMKKLLGEQEDVKPGSSFLTEIDKSFRSSGRGKGRKNKNLSSNCPSQNNQPKEEIKLEPGETSEVKISVVDSCLDNLEAVDSKREGIGGISITINKGVSQNNGQSIFAIKVESDQKPDVAISDVDSCIDELETVDSEREEIGRTSIVMNKGVSQNNGHSIDEIEMESDQNPEVAISDVDSCFDELEAVDSEREEIVRISKRNRRVPNSSSKVRKPKKAHSKQESVDCTVCDYSCISASRLLRHMRSHTKERNYLCTICDFKCCQSADLRAHLRSHTGEKLFHCPFCDYRATRNNTLQRHLKSHTAEKPHSCTICDYSCIAAADLRAHMYKHKGIKPFHCKICDFRTAKSSDLTKHVMTHTGEKPYKCLVCDYRCCRAYHLKCHMKRHAAKSSEHRKR